MDNKLIQNALDGITHLRDGLEKILEANKPIQPEPQAGDVWASGIYTIFVHRDKKDTTRDLTFTYMDGDTQRDSCCDIRELVKEYRYTRIFSLSDHLKGKD